MFFMCLNYFCLSLQLGMDHSIFGGGGSWDKNAARLFFHRLKQESFWKIIFSSGHNVGQNIFFTPDAGQNIFLTKNRVRFFFKKFQAQPRKSNSFSTLTFLEELRITPFIYSWTCIQRSPLGQTKTDLIREVTF